MISTVKVGQRRRLIEGYFTVIRHLKNDWWLCQVNNQEKLEEVRTEVIQSFDLINDALKISDFNEVF
jgi:hypothetical protein